MSECLGVYPQMTQMDSDKKDPQTYAILGAAMEVHGELGSGFLEAVYQEALALELTARGIPFQKELDLDIDYKRQKLARSYRADFVCFDSVIVELKALSGLTTIEQSQVLNYLKATGLERALLLNFGKGKLEFKRLILSSHPRLSASSVDNSS